MSAVVKISPDDSNVSSGLQNPVLESVVLNCGYILELPQKALKVLLL